MSYRNRELLDLAKQAPCCARFEYACKPGTVVSAHMNVGKGMGHKVPDYAIAFLCHEAHRLIDEGGWERDLSRAEWQRAHWRSMEWAWGNALIKVHAGNAAVTEEPRTPSQNDKLWPGLRDISKQVPWQVNGQEVTLDEDGWKDVLSAYYFREQRVAKGIDGGIVLLGRPTRKMGKRQMSELLMMIQEFGDRRGVQWSDPKWLAMVAEHRKWLEREEAKTTKGNRAA